MPKICKIVSMPDRAVSFYRPYHRFQPEERCLLKQSVTDDLPPTLARVASPMSQWKRFSVSLFLRIKMGHSESTPNLYTGPCPPDRLLSFHFTIRVYSWGIRLSKSRRRCSGLLWRHCLHFRSPGRPTPSGENQTYAIISIDYWATGEYIYRLQAAVSSWSNRDDVLTVC